MRIISGKARGTKIATIKENTTRPTLDRVKESLFNILQNKIVDSVVLDLFAGSGALGLEALSRGAKRAVFCDENPEAINVIRQNLKKTHLEDNATVYNYDYKICLDKLKIKFNLIFLDPPYKSKMACDAVKLIEKNNLLENEGIIIIETEDTEQVKNDLRNIKLEKNNLEISDTRKYGRASLIFISRRG